MMAGHFTQDSPAEPEAVFAPPRTSGFDCETAALLRASVGPFFERAQSWAALSADLNAHGYGLAIREGKLVLTDRTSGHRICTVRYLGSSLRELAARLGRPCVVARRDRPGAGDLLTGAAQPL